MLLVDVDPCARSGIRYPQLVQKRAVARTGCPQLGQGSTIHPFWCARVLQIAPIECSVSFTLAQSIAETMATISRGKQLREVR